MSNGDDYAMGDLAATDPDQLARERAIRFRANADNMAIQPPPAPEPSGVPPGFAMGSVAATDSYRPLGNDPWTNTMIDRGAEQKAYDAFRDRQMNQQIMPDRGVPYGAMTPQEENIALPERDQLPQSPFDLGLMVGGGPFGRAAATVSGALTTASPAEAARLRLPMGGILSPHGMPIAAGDFRASTRFPTAKGAPENPLTHHLGIGTAEMAAEPGFATNVALLSKIPGFAHLADMDEQSAVQAYLQQAKENMNYVYQKSPDVMKQRSPVWYEGAHNIADALSRRWGIPLQSSAGNIASLSPQMPWFVNASLGERVGDIMTGAAAGRPMSSEMRAFAETAPGMQKYLATTTKEGKTPNLDLYRSIQGKSLDALDTPEQKALWIRLYDEAHNPKGYREITPEGEYGDFATTPIGKQLAQIHWGSFDPIEKAVKIIESGGDMNIISPALGAKHKVRSFYNNILDPNDPRFGDVTADTHQVAAAQMRPLGASAPEVNANFGTGGGAASSAVSGVQGLYGLNADATRMMAMDQGLLPRAGQSGGWESIRQLFPDTWKTDKNRAAVDNIWSMKDRGLLTTEQARDAIFKLAGGIAEPGWARRGLTTIAPAHGSTYR